MAILHLDALLERLTTDERARFNDLRHEFATDRDAFFNAIGLRGYVGLLYELDPTVNPVGVEYTMRLQYGTLDHLPHSIFLEEITLAKQCEAVDPGFLHKTAVSYGAGSDFDQAERFVQPLPRNAIIPSPR